MGRLHERRADPALFLPVEADGHTRFERGPAAAAAAADRTTAFYTGAVEQPELNTCTVGS